MDLLTHENEDVTLYLKPEAAYLKTQCQILTNLNPHHAAVRNFNSCVIGDI